MTQTTTLYCYVHPNRETTLRCNRCERPICAQCAVRTPTGYRCKECVREQKKTFDTALWYDYVIGPSLTTVLSLVASSLIAALSFIAGFFMLLISAALAVGAARFISDTVLRVMRRRSRALFVVIAAGVVIGALPAAGFFLTSGNLFALLWIGIYVVVATPAVYTRVSGIQL